MKILLIHNSHRSGSSSGDDAVFKKETELLENRGHYVIRLNPSNDEFDKSMFLKKISIVFQIPWSVNSYLEIKKIIKKEKPDIVHVHNFFPLLSPSIYHAVKSAGVHVVQTLHDFRFFCPMAFFLREGNICIECKDSGPLRSIRSGCFKKSKIQTVPVAIMLKLHHWLKTFKEKIDAYICLTESQKRIFIDGGFDKERLFIKPNFVDDTHKIEKDSKGDYAVFIGRLGEEKGIETLIKAWKDLEGVPLKIVGSGPDADKFKKLAQRINIHNIEFLGYRPHIECMNILAGARFLIMPSIWYETFGLTIVEAFSHYKPVIASNLGAMADIISDGMTGLLFKPKDFEELSKKARWLWNNHEECLRMGQNARKEYEAKYTPKKNYEMLMGIYTKVLADNKNI